MILNGVPSPHLTHCIKCMWKKKVYSWIWILALSISSRNLKLYFSDHYLIYEVKLICFVKLWSVRKSHIASEYCLPINKCSCHCCYHYFNIYFIICYLGDEKYRTEVPAEKREPSEQIGKDEVETAFLWNEIHVHTAYSAVLFVPGFSCSFPSPLHLTNKGVEVPRWLVCHQHKESAPCPASCCFPWGKESS